MICWILIILCGSGLIEEGVGQSTATSTIMKGRGKHNVIIVIIIYDLVVAANNVGMAHPDGWEWIQRCGRVWLCCCW